MLPNSTSLTHFTFAVVCCLVDEDVIDEDLLRN